MEKIKVLYVGSLNPASNAFKRFTTLKKIGVEAEAIDTEKLLYNSILTPVYHRISLGPAVTILNKQVLRKTVEYQPNIIWVDNKPYLSKSTLKKLKEKNPGLSIINVVTDDPNGRYKAHWSLARTSASYYDWHFVQRPENIKDYKSWAAQNVDFCFRSFDPDFHKKLDLSEEDFQKFHTSVGFIGTYEEERAEFIAYLIEKGITVKVIGDGWPGKKYWEVIERNYSGPSIYGVDYVKAINGMDIALHFLRKGNRDQQDSRTFEIPACGTFMLAERSKLHEQFFEEGSEVAFFESKEELLEKLHYYQENVEKRKQVAIAGYNRCIRSGYDHASRLKIIIEKVMGSSTNG